MLKQKIDSVLRYQNEDGTIGGGHLGLKKPVGYKYKAKQILVKKKVKK